MDELCIRNDDGEFSKSLTCCQYPGELELKLEHSETHATFLDLDIKTVDEIFVYKLSDKRDNFPFFIAPMPHFESNIHQSYFVMLFFQNFFV